jgi:hypothetical protein
MHKKILAWATRQNSTLLFVLLLIWGTALRFVYFTSSPFGFDQIQIADNAARIAGGDISLIGPRTGPAEMFTGPLIYYLAAPLTFLFSPAVSTLFTAAVISLITGLTLYFLSKRYLDQNYSLLITVIYFFSPLLIHFDRISWNPNLTVLSASLVFFPLLKREKLHLIDIAVVTVGVFLGYQAHFSGLLLLPLATLCLIMRREYKRIPIPIGGFILSIAPTILFDLRNEWLNYRGLVSLLTNKDHVASYMILPRLGQKGFIIVETAGKLFFEQNLPILVFMSGFLFLILFIYSYRKKSEREHNQRLINFSLVWIIVTLLFFALYRLSTPEYYFFILLPVLFLITARVFLFLQISPRHLVLPLGIYASLFTHVNYADKQGLTYGNQENTVKEVITLTQFHSIKRIVYDMETVDTLGIKYLLAQKNIEFQEEGADIHISYPQPSDLFSTVRVGGISVWLDPRQSIDYTYFEESQFFVGLPNTWKAVRIMTPLLSNDQTAVYEIYKGDATEKVELHVTKLKDTLPLLMERIEADSQKQLKTIGLRNEPRHIWRPTTVEEKRGYYVQIGKLLFFIDTEDADIISKIEVIAPDPD